MVINTVLNPYQSAMKSAAFRELRNHLVVAE